MPINTHEIVNGAGRVFHRFGIPAIGGLSGGTLASEFIESLRLSLTTVDQTVARLHMDVACGAGLIFIGTFIAYHALAKHYLSPQAEGG